MSNSQRWEVKVLDPGRCEPLKAAVHGVLFATVAVCAAYNGAAWLKRRQPHLAINAVIYGLAVVWERGHIVRHLTACSGTRPEALAPTEPAPEPAPQRLTDAA